MPDYNGASAAQASLNDTQARLLAARELEILLKRDLNLKDRVAQALASKGIPWASLSRAQAGSLAKAYTSERYLTAWRANVNPTYAKRHCVDGQDISLLDADDADTYAEINFGATLRTETETETETVTDLAKSSLVTTFNEAAFFDKLRSVMDVARQGIEKQAEGIVERLADTRLAEKLARTTLKLDDAARERIVALAKETAQAEIEARLAPRRIEVRAADGGAVRDLGLQHEQFPRLLQACNARDHRGFRLNVWLTGPTGSGKTTAAESVAKALDLPFGTDGSLDADYKVLGFRDANGNVISTQFLDIYEKGGIYVADEIDNWLPSALLALNAALANGFAASPRGLIKRHPDACIIACANTWGFGATGDYVGRCKLDAASLDRFQPKLNWPIDEQLEHQVALAQGGAEGHAWHLIVTSARKSAQTQGLKVIISPRATFAGIALLKAGFSSTEVAYMTIFAGLSPEQERAIHSQMQVR